MCSMWLSHCGGALGMPSRINIFLMQQAHALDVQHFFTGMSGMKPPWGDFIWVQELHPPKVCKLCSYVQIFSHLFCFLITSSLKYGSDQSTIPNGVPKYIYSPNTTNATLQDHLHHIHGMTWAWHNKWPPTHVQLGIEVGTYTTYYV